MSVSCSFDPRIPDWNVWSPEVLNVRDHSKKFHFFQSTFVSRFSAIYTRVQGCLFLWWANRRRRPNGRVESSAMRHVTKATNLSPCLSVPYRTVPDHMNNDNLWILWIGPDAKSKSMCFFCVREPYNDVISRQWHRRIDFWAIQFMAKKFVLIDWFFVFDLYFLFVYKRRQFIDFNELSPWLSRFSEYRRPTLDYIRKNCWTLNRADFHSF